MQFRLNPVLIAGYDVLYIGKKGFTSLAKARKALIRPKGAPKTEPWIEIDFAKYKKKVQREEVLTRTLQKLTKKRDEEAEKVIKREKKKAAKVPEAEKIIFEKTDVVDKIIKTREGRYFDVKKYYFETPKSYEFVQARNMNIFIINRYTQAVKKEFLKEVYSKHGKASYFVRFYHDYKGLPSTQENDPLDKGFGGMSTNRQVMNKADVQEQFEILTEIYLESFSRYIQFARADTHFRFTGFTAEVIVDERDQEGVKLLPQFTKKRKTRSKARKKKKAQRVAKKKSKKKKTKKSKRK